MKNFLLLFFSCILFIPATLAQGQKDRAKMREDLQNFKIDFLAKEMDLSEKEKSEFIPIYKEYDSERRKVGAEAWKFEHELSKKKDASDADYKKLSELQQSARSKDGEIVRKYDEKFASFLSAKQIYNMHKGEAKFFEKMKEMHKKFGEKNKQPNTGSSKKRKHDKNHRQEPRPFDIFSQDEF